MLISIQQNRLILRESSFNKRESEEVEDVLINKCSGITLDKTTPKDKFMNTDSSDFIVTGTQANLYNTLWRLSLYFDIELM